MFHAECGMAPEGGPPYNRLGCDVVKLTLLKADPSLLEPSRTEAVMWNTRGQKILLVFLSRRIGRS